jgi:hypothetical protein
LVNLMMDLELLLKYLPVENDDSNVNVNTNLLV